MLSAQDRFSQVCKDSKKQLFSQYLEFLPASKSFAESGIQQTERLEESVSQDTFRTREHRERR
jgi:hypothetical protein